jgi:hypothetical protein
VATPVLDEPPTTAKAIALLRAYLDARDAAKVDLARLCAEEEARVGEVNRQREAADEATRLEKAEAKAAYNAERAAWISEHGSPRLKRMLAEGVRLNNTYLDERLAAERPDWKYYEDICGEEKGIRDPEQAVFDALDEARKVAPDARVAWLADGEHVFNRRDQHGDSMCECGASVDGEGFRPGPIAVSEFMGHQIILRLAEESCAQCGASLRDGYSLTLAGKRICAQCGDKS